MNNINWANNFEIGDFIGRLCKSLKFIEPKCTWNVNNGFSFESLNTIINEVRLIAPEVYSYFTLLSGNDDGIDAIWTFRMGFKENRNMKYFIALDQSHWHISLTSERVSDASHSASHSAESLPKYIDVCYGCPWIIRTMRIWLSVKSTENVDLC